MDRLRNAVGLNRSVRNDGDSGLLDAMPLSESLLGVGEGDEEDGNAVRRVTPTRVHSQRSGADDALSAQMRNNEQFQEDLRREEEQIYSEIRARRIIEEEDRKLAQRLQEELSGQSDALRLQCTVPPGVIGGQFIAVQIPGKSGVERVQVPPGLQPGMSFTYVTSGVNGAQGQALANPSSAQVVRVQIPQGVSAGGTFPVVLPSGVRVSVMVPTGCEPGDELDIPVGPSPPQQQQQQQQAPLTEEQRREREEFLAALPEDIRAEVIAAEGAQLTGAPPAQTQQPEQPPAPAPAPPPPMTEAERKEREEFLAALPEDIRAEILAAETQQQQQQQPTPPPPASTAAPPPPPPPAYEDVAAQGDQEETDFLSGAYGQDQYESSNPDLLTGSDAKDGAPTQEQEDGDSLLDFGNDDSTANLAPKTQLDNDDSNDLLSFSGSAAPVETTSQAAAPSSESVTSALPMESAKPPGDPFAGAASATAASMGASASAAAAGSKPPLQRLKEAREKLDKGEITQEEFDVVKKEVIAAI